MPSVDLSSTGGRLLQDRQFRLPTLLLLAGLLALAILALGASPAEAATIVVTTTSDAVTSGDGCSLREAIVNANADQQTNTDCAAGSGTDTITFNIPANTDPGCNAGTGICTITPSAGSIVFPTITAPVVVDGYTQPGAAPNTNPTGGLNTALRIEISGANFAGAGTVPPVFRVQGGNSTIRGLTINRFATTNAFSPAILLETNGGNTIAGNFIGTSVAGTVARPNSGGIGVRSSNNTIGGTTPAARNLFLNGAGVDTPDLEVNGNTNTVQGNLFGSNVLGTAILASSPGAGLVVRPFQGSAPTDNTIGGTTAAARNAFAGYLSGAVVIRSAGTGTTVRGNSVGTNATGTSNIPNVYGVVVENTSDVAIGGTATGAGNLIRFNILTGVVVRGASSTGVSILGNSIIGNGSLGIDLGGDGGDTNDVNDQDTGPNTRQNSPVLSAPVSSVGSASVVGVLNSTPSTTFRVELFSNFGCDTSGFGEGETFLGSVAVTTDAVGNARFSAPVAVPPGRVASATATDPSGNTSEFAACVQAVAGADLAITKTGPPTVAPGAIVYTLTVTNNGPGPAQNVGVIDQTPPGLSLSTNTGACTTAFPCLLGTLAVGQSRTITSTYTLPQAYTGPGTVTNTATVSSSTPDAVSSNDSATTSATVTADLAISKVGPAQTTPGAEVVYTITVVNGSAAPLTGVTVADPTPAGLEFIGNAGACTTPFPCTLGSLEAQATRVITARYRVIATAPGPAPITNTASVGGTGPDARQLQAIAVATTTVVIVPPPVEPPPLRVENDDLKPPKETEEQRQQRQRTNRSNKDDVHTEGNVVGVRLTLDDPVPHLASGFIAEPDAVPYVLIANKDGVQQIVLRHDAKLVGPSVKIGDYVSADGEKQSEALFVADDLDIER